MRRRVLLSSLGALPVAASVLALSGCGFRLRGTPSFAFTSVYVGAAERSTLADELRRTLAASGQVRLVTEAAQINQAQVVLDVLGEQREKVVVGVSSSGQVREFVLRQRLRFRLRTPQGKELIADTELLQQRDISYNETLALAKEAEENRLYLDMQTDVVQQLMRRLASVKSL